jgi:hypothetical protein
VDLRGVGDPADEPVEPALLLEVGVGDRRADLRERPVAVVGERLLGGEPGHERVRLDPDLRHVARLELGLVLADPDVGHLVPERVGTQDQGHDGQEDQDEQQEGAARPAGSLRLLALAVFVLVHRRHVTSLSIVA